MNRAPSDTHLLVGNRRIRGIEQPNTNSAYSLAARFQNLFIAGITFPFIIGAGYTTTFPMLPQWFDLRGEPIREHDDTAPVHRYRHPPGSVVHLDARHVPAAPRAVVRGGHYLVQGYGFAWSALRPSRLA